MCFVGYKNNLKVADRDIKCYKCLQSNLYSPCYEFAYKLGENIKSDLYFHMLDESWKGKLMASKGLHSYISSETAKRIAKRRFHFYSQRFSCASDSPLVVECIIPKGSQYLTNGIEYVSDSLTPIKVVFDRFEWNQKKTKEMLENYQL